MGHGAWYEGWSPVSWIASVLSFSPAQLAAQRLKKAASAHPNQLYGMARAAAAHFVAAVQFHCQLPIHGQQREIGNTFNTYQKGRIPAHHNRP